MIVKDYCPDCCFEIEVDTKKDSPIKCTNCGNWCVWTEKKPVKELNPIEIEMFEIDLRYQIQRLGLNKEDVIEIINKLFDNQSIKG